VTKWEDWGGVPCSECGEESFRILDGKCLRCFENVKTVSEDKLEKRAIFRGLKRKLKDAQEAARRKGRSL